MSTTNRYLKSFVIGSSFPVTYLFLNAVIDYEKTGIINFSYKDYSLYAPIYLGLMAAAATYLGIKFGMELKKRLLLISIISMILIGLTITTRKAYKYTDIDDWISQIIKMGFAHLITFNIIIFYLETNT